MPKGLQGFQKGNQINKGRKPLNPFMIGHNINLGKHLSEETKRKISETKQKKFKKQGYLNSPETRKKISLALKGKKLSEETKKKIKESLIGYKHTKETKEKLSRMRKGKNNSFYGKKHSIETRQKLSQLLKGRISPKGMFGKKHSEETKIKMRENSGRWKGGISKARNYKRFKKFEYQNRKLIAIGTHTLEQWQELKKKYDYMCLCCKQTEPFIKLTEDHIIPLSKGGSDNIENIQPLCGSCNSIKHTKIINYLFIQKTSLLHYEHSL